MKWNICPQCGEPKQSFWEHEFQFPCKDCSESNHIYEEVINLRLAYAKGKVTWDSITELGKQVCTLNI
jgi:hypothetical protein